MPSAATGAASQATKSLPFIRAIKKCHNLYSLLKNESNTQVLQNNLSIRRDAGMAYSYKKILQNVLDFSVWKKRTTITQLVKIVSTVLGTIVCPAGIVISKIINIAINIALKAIKYFITLKNITSLENAILNMPNPSRHDNRDVLSRSRLEKIASSKILSTFFVASTSSRQLINIRDTKFTRQKDFHTYTSAYRELGLQTLDLTIARPTEIELQNELEFSIINRLTYFGLQKGIT